MADIIELILADHRRIRRLLDAVEDAAYYSRQPGVSCLPAVWRRLAELLGQHAEAKQEIFYPALCWHGIGDAAEAEEAAADLLDIQEAIADGELGFIDSGRWWRASAAATRLTREYIAREEHGLLAALSRAASSQLREQLGRQWAAFIIARMRDAWAEGADSTPMLGSGPKVSARI